MASPFFTIGHSTRAVTEFVDLLQGEQVQLVVDVRTVPRSRSNPQFNATFFRKRSRQNRSAMSASPRWEVCAESSMKLRQA